MIRNKSEPLRWPRYILLWNHKKIFQTGEKKLISLSLTLSGELILKDFHLKIQALVVVHFMISLIGLD